MYTYVLSPPPKKTSFLNHVTWNTIAASHNADNSQCQLAQWWLMHSCLSSSGISCPKSEKSFRICIPVYITTVRLVWQRENAWAISVTLMVMQVHLHCQMLVVWVLLPAYATDLWSATATLTSGGLWQWHVAFFPPFQCCFTSIEAIRLVFRVLLEKFSHLFCVLCLQLITLEWCFTMGTQMLLGPTTSTPTTSQWVARSICY